MYDIYNELEELCETVAKELTESNKKVRDGSGKLTAGDVEYLDKLTHMMKSIKTTLAMMEADEGYSGNDYSGRTYGGTRTMYTRPMYDYSMTNRTRDARGRYSGRYSRADGEFMDKVRDLMETAPDERTREEFRRMIDRMEK